MAYHLSTITESSTKREDNTSVKKDSSKNILEKDAPCARPELLRTICSFAAMHKTELVELRVSIAFLQAKGIDRQI